MKTSRTNATNTLETRNNSSRLMSVVKTSPRYALLLALAVIGLSLFLALPLLRTTASSRSASNNAKSSNRGLKATTTGNGPLAAGACDLGNNPALPMEVESSTGTLGGTPTGYASLGAAFTAINGGVFHTGVITIDVCESSNEGATVATLSGATSSYSTLTISPVGTRTITGAPLGGFPMIDFDGADNVTINGVNSGGNTLTISNTTVSATAQTSTIRYVNDATGNTIQNATINGAGTAASTGTIIFSNTTGATGNDNNTVTASNIGPVAATFPTNAIFSSGTTTSTTTRNSGVSITNNNIFDFYNAGAVVAGGVNLAGSTDWTITGNSFYQTASRAQIAGGGYIVITIADTSGVNFIVSNNFIGGSAASAGGTAWTETGATTHTFIGIRMSVGSSVVSSLQNNTIQNINNTTSSTSSINAGISAPTGAMNIGTTTGNTIGATTGTGSITWTAAGANQLSGILAGTGTPNGINISNNKVGSITVGGTAVTTLYGIRIQGAATAAYTISNNTIGSTSTANSITNNSNGSFVGISGTQTLFPATVSNNTIQNLQVTSTGTSASLRGIELTGSISGQTISGNTIANFSTTSTNTASLSGTAILAIFFSGGATSGNTITTNTIRDLASTTSGATAVTNQGIYIASTPGTTISRNFIYNLTTASTSATSQIIGIQLFNSSATINMYNNMMRLGVGVGNNPSIRGIHDNSATSSPTNIRFNSIFISGTQGAATVNTACIQRVVASTMDIRNNILWNNRASTGAPGVNLGRHYAIWTTTASGTITTNFNNLFVNGASGATVGFLTSDRVTLVDWQGAGAGFDTASFSTDPLFVDPTNATTPDLHLQASNPESNAAQTVAGIVDDFDGQARPQPAATNPDIGADEGVFTISTDLQAPAISYASLPNTSSTGDRTLNITVTDNAGVPTAGIGLPVIYYKKNALAYVNSQCSFVSGSSYTCPILAASLGGVVPTDVISYYVVAQDNSGLVSANPSAGAGAFTTNPPAAGTPPTTPNTYTIVNAVGGSFNVGTAETYTSLTNAGGLFAFLNANEVTSNVTINITTDLTGELGTNALNENAGGFSVLIRPSGAARVISTSAATSFIKLNGADNVTIDGSLSGGTDRSLTLTGTGAAALVWIGTNATSGANSNTVKNCIFSGPGAFGGQGIIASSGTTFGGAAEFPNSNNTVRNNDFSRVQNALFASGNTTTPDQNWTVADNTLGSATVADKLSFRGFFLGFSQNFLITNNTISGVNSSTVTSSTMSGIQLNGTLSGTVSRNIIRDIKHNNTTGWGSNGIYLTGATGSSVTVINNFISDVASQGFGGIASTDNGYGIAVETGSGYNIWNNTVVMNTNQGAGAASGITAAINFVSTVSAAGGVDLRNNILMSTQTLGTRYGAIVGGATNIFSNINRNDYFAQNVGRVGATTHAGLLAWQGATGQDVDSQAVDPLFVTPTDFHLTGASTMLGNATSLAAVNNDIDNDLRDSAPDIGADELPTGGRSGVIPAGTYRDGRLLASSLGGNTVFTGTLSLGGIVTTGANTLTIDCTGSVTGASPSIYIIGNLQKNFCAAGVKGFEVGTANGYSPVSVNVTAGTFPANFTVTAKQGPQPNFAAPQYALQRYWTLSGSAGLTADLTFNYLDPTDIPVTANENNFVIFKYNGGFTMPGGTVSPGLNEATITGVTSFSDWTLAQPNSPTAAPATISGRVTTTSGAPLGGVTMNLSGARSARTVTDSNGNYRFLNIDTGNFYNVTPAITNYHFSPASRSYSLLANVTDAVFTGSLDAVPTGNAIDTPEFFVRQHYLDFLGREPDDSGLIFWSDQMRGCGNDFNCLERRTINVSAAYFLSIEHQETGGLVDGLYRASYGRAPLYAEFVPDTATVAEGVIVNQTGWEDLLAANKQEFLDAWVERPAFRAAYDNLGNDGYVDTLISHTGVDFTAAERAALVGGLADGSLTRAQVLGQIAQNERFEAAKFNEAFVRMQYFGYLRRDPDDSGFHFWLNKLNEFNGNFEQAEMVKAFLVSGEYRDRFSQ